MQMVTAIKAITTIMSSTEEVFLRLFRSILMEKWYFL